MSTSPTPGSAQSARNALDAAGRFLLAVNRTGRVLWCTPQASKLLGTAFSAFAVDFRLLLEIMQWLVSIRERGTVAAGEPPVAGNDWNFSSSYIGQIGADELLLRLIESDPRRRGDRGCCQRSC